MEKQKEALRCEKYRAVCTDAGWKTRVLIQSVSYGRTWPEQITDQRLATGAYAYPLFHTIPAAPASPFQSFGRFLSVFFFGDGFAAGLAPPTLRDDPAFRAERFFSTRS